MRETCYQCYRPKTSCLCHEVNTYETNTRIVILMHPMERQKVKNNTGRLTHLALSNSEVITDIDFTQNKRVNELIENDECSILYPSKEAHNISQTPLESKDNRVIFVIDATWPCAKKMMKLSKNLHPLPRISFDTTQTSRYRIKQQPHDLCLSTIEACYELLIQMNEIPDDERFLNPFMKMIEYQVACANDPDRKNYHHGRHGFKEAHERHRSLKFDKRNLFFK
jgi:DTW domain-containing protein YfiP